MQLPQFRATSVTVEEMPPQFSTQTIEMAPSGGGGAPPPGCWPNGTQCRGFVQHMVYCCPDGQTWSRQEGWCVGWWDALPCRGW